ncbi:MAG TPA: hypothetical protein DCW31_09440 [Lactobacillus sp.]|nr:hypothetical protein [Lactobacillus sp.]
MNTEPTDIQTWLHDSRKAKGLTGHEVLQLLQDRYKIRISKSSFYRYEDSQTSLKAIPLLLIVALCDIYDRDFKEPFDIVRKQISIE